jgi:hypothetical protein
MNLIKRSIAAAELLLIFPAALFMTALFVRNLQPTEYEPAHTAQQVVNWYAGHPHVGLWLFLIALPLIVLASGATALLRTWKADGGLREDARQALAMLRVHMATLFVAAATLIAGCVLAIVALHMLTE